MAKSKADVTVHVDESYPNERCEALCESLSHMSGVERVRCAEHNKHLLIVDYDPDTVDSGKILHRITDQGLHAELIGL